VSEPVNELHAVLRKLSVADAIALIAAQIPKRGHDVVKNDPGVYAWVMENAKVLAPIARKGGLH
jgi:hypothetical protein